MSTVKYRYENNVTKVVGGVKETIKENIIDGEKGVSFSFLKKVGDKSFYKIHVKEVEKDKFQMMEKHDEKVTEGEVSKTELMKKLKGNKDLAFVEKYLSKERAKYQKGGAKKRSTGKKGSKKSTRKGSKKSTAKKGSKKTARKGSKKSTAKKGSKKSAKKGSKKGSKKTVRKGSKKTVRKGSKKSAAKKGSKKTARKGSKKSSSKRKKSSA